MYALFKPSVIINWVLFKVYRRYFLRKRAQDLGIRNPKVLIWLFALVLKCQFHGNY